LTVRCAKDVAIITTRPVSSSAMSATFPITFTAWNRHWIRNRRNIAFPFGNASGAPSVKFADPTNRVSTPTGLTKPTAPFAVWLHAGSQWLHAACDLIRNEREPEFCAEDGYYTCVLCRPPDQQPPQLHPSNASDTALALAPPPSVSVQSTSNLSGSRQNKQSSSATPPPSPVPGLQELTGGSLINESSNSNRPKSSASSSSQFVVDGVSL
jgi:hypothetical protein